MMITAKTVQLDTCFDTVEKMGTRIGFTDSEEGGCRIGLLPEDGTRIGFDTVEEMGTRIGFNKDADTCPDFVPSWMTTELVAA